MSIFILGDARRLLREIPDNSFDMVLTDPMYDLDSIYQNEYAYEFQRICKGTVLVFCSPENAWKAPRYLFWIKQPSTKNYTKNYGRFVEQVAYYPSKEGYFFSDGLYWGNLTGVYHDTIEGKRLHEFQKPLSLISRFIEIHTKPGHKILDPFGGSGTTLIAGTKMGRDVTSFEIHPETYYNTLKRITENGIILGNGT